jgi:hypothetical protein
MSPGRGKRDHQNIGSETLHHDVAQGSRSLDDSAGLMALAVGAIGIDCDRMTGLNRPAVGS